VCVVTGVLGELGPLLLQALLFGLLNQKTRNDGCDQKYGERSKQWPAGLAFGRGGQNCACHRF
jgi:hypothetical protein